MYTKIDFTDRGVPDVYGDMAQDCVHALSRFYDDMEALCRVHAYKPMVDFTNNIQRFYAEDFRSYVMARFAEWENSGSSLPALARNVHAGYEAENTGRRFMEELRDRLEGMFNRTFTPIRVDDAAPSLDDQDIEKINDHLRSFAQAANRATENALSIARSRSSENLLYSLISPVLRDTGESLCECFGSMLNAVLEGVGLYKMGIDRTIAELFGGAVMDTTASNLTKWPADEVFY